MSKEIVTITEPQRLVDFADENDMLFHLTQNEASLLLKYAHSKSYDIYRTLGEGDGQLFMKKGTVYTDEISGEKALSKSEWEAVTLDEVVDEVCEMNYELRSGILERTEMQGVDFIDRNVYESLMKDSKRLEAIFARTEFSQKLDEMAESMAKEVIQSYLERKERKKLSEKAKLEENGLRQDVTKEMQIRETVVNEENGMEQTSSVSAKEPTVIILRSENDRLQEGTTMPLVLANDIMSILDKENLGSLDGYKKMKFRINFIMNGISDSYEGVQNLGEGYGTLIGHIEKYNEYFVGNEKWEQWFLQSKGEKALEADREERDKLLHEFIPYLKMHCNLSKMEQTARAALENNADMKSMEKDYYTALQQYVSKCRGLLNQGAYDLPPIPQLADFEIGREPIEGQQEKKGILSQETVNEEKRQNTFLGKGR